jgi:hypothetical protein
MCIAYFTVACVLRHMVKELREAKSLIPQMTSSEFLSVIDVRIIGRCTGFVLRELPLVLL